MCCGTPFNVADSLATEVQSSGDRDFTYLLILKGLLSIFAQLFFRAEILLICHPWNSINLTFNITGEWMATRGSELKLD